MKIKESNKFKREEQEQEIGKLFSGFKNILPRRELLLATLDKLSSSSVTKSANPRYTYWTWTYFKYSSVVVLAVAVLVFGRPNTPLDPTTEVQAMEIENSEILVDIDNANWLSDEQAIELEIDMLFDEVDNDY